MKNKRNCDIVVTRKAETRCGMKEIRERGYAKINLHLDVTGRLEGGYHQVETVMQTVTLYDEITLTPEAETDREICLTCNVPEVPTNEKNLVYRAIALYFERVGQRFGLRVHIQKSIPMAAGMGESNEIMSDMGIAMMAGMIVSTLVTLVFTPVFYSVIDDIPAFFKKRFGKKRKA